MTDKNGKCENGRQRDERGRWLPGHCPNPKGRPPKKPKIPVNLADIHRFRTSSVEVKTPEGAKMVTREEALNLRIFEDAMRGRASAQKLLYQEFEKDLERIAETEAAYMELFMEWYIRHPKAREPGFMPPAEVIYELDQYRRILRYYNRRTAQ